MGKHRKLIVLFLVAALAVGGTGSALAKPDPPSEAPTAADLAARCEKASQKLDQLNTLARKLSERIAKLQAKIAGGQLTDEQLARAQALLAKLQDRQAKLAERIQTLGGKIAEHCSVPE